MFDQLESQAAQIIIQNDFENALLYRYEVGGGDEENPEPVNDGFNSDYAPEEVSSRPIKVAIARGRGSSNLNTEYIGTTTTQDIHVNDVIEIVNECDARRRYVVRAFEPVRDHTYLELDEVRKNGA